MLSTVLLYLGTGLVFVGSCVVARFLSLKVIDLVIKIKDSAPAQRVFARLQNIGSADTDEEKIELADRLMTRFVRSSSFSGWYIVGLGAVAAALSLVSLDACYFMSIVAIIALVFWLQSRKIMAKKISTNSWLFVQNFHLRLAHRQDLYQALSDMVSGDLTPLGKPLELLLQTHYQSNIPNLLRHMAEITNLPLFLDLADQIDLATAGRVSLQDAVKQVEERSLREMNLESREDARSSVSRLTVFSIIAILLPVAVGFGIPLITLLSAGQ